MKKRTSAGIKKQSLQDAYQEYSKNEKDIVSDNYAYGPINKNEATYRFEKIITQILEDHANNTHNVSFKKLDGKNIISYKDEITGNQVHMPVEELLNNVNFTHLNLSNDIVNKYASDKRLFILPIKPKEFEQKINNAGPEYQYLKGLEYGEMLAINNYTKGSYRPMNNLLKSPNKANANTIANTLLHIAIVSNGLNKIPNNTTTEFAIRNQNQTDLEEFIQNAETSGVIVPKGFSSAATESQDAFDKGTGGIKIIYKNVPGVDISPLSNKPEEKEVLIKPSTQLKITGYTKTQDGNIITATGANVLLSDKDKMLKTTKKIHVTPKKPTIPKAFLKPIAEPKDIIASEQQKYDYNNRGSIFSSIATRRQEMEQNLPMFRPGSEEEYQNRKLKEKKQAMHHDVDMSGDNDNDYSAQKNPKLLTPREKLEQRAQGIADILLNDELKNIKELEKKIQLAHTPEEKLNLQNLQHDQIQKLNNQLEIIEQQLEQSKYLEGSKLDGDMTQLAEIKAQKLFIEGQIKALEKIKDKSDEFIGAPPPPPPPPPPAPPLPESWDKMPKQPNIIIPNKKADKPTKTKEELDSALLSGIKNDNYDNTIGSLRKNELFLALQKKFATNKQEKKSPPPTSPKSDEVGRNDKRRGRNS